MVAACALLLGIAAFAIRVAQRYQEYNKLYIKHVCIPIVLRRCNNSETIEKNYTSEIIDYHQRMERKYDLARQRPWLTVEPDPAPPIRPAEPSGRPPVRLEDVPAIAEILKRIPDTPADGDSPRGGAARRE